MDKEGGDGGDAAGKQPPDGLLDAANLFGAYWGRDGGGSGGAAAAQAQAQAQAALFGFGSRYPPPTTLGVAANQAASLGLHPAASAAWWSMASHLAAQDYLARLQASGLNFPPLADPYAALSALSGGGQGLKQPQKPGKLSSRNERSGRSSTSSSASTKDKSPSTSSANSQNMSEWGSSYGLPKTSSPSAMHHSASLSSLASLNSLVSAPHQSKPSSKPSAAPQPSKKPSSSSSSSSKGKERELALLRGDLMLAQAAAHGAYHAAVAAAAKGKNMSPLYPFGMPGSDKDGRHGGIDSLTGLPHTILSDPSSVLGGVRLPPDTEIIKYTSSLAGPKVKAHAGSGTTTRGRKKTISLDPPHVSVHPADRSAPLPSKRPKLQDEYGNSRSSVEVIRLPNKPDRPGHNSMSGTPPPNLSDYAGISRELLQTIASQSGVSLAALERQLAGSTDAGLNLSTKMGEDSPLDLGVKSSAMDDDAPLNLSLKPTPASSQASDALSRLTSLSSSLNASSSHDRISRRKPGAKPRRVAPEMNPVPDAPRPKSSGSEDSESVAGWAGREGRPRNLGRGVSKPKKNTVASLLAQSRALGLRPALAHQLLAETDLEKLKALLGETASTDSECPSDSCPSDSDASDTSRRPNDAQLRLPLALGWKRVTVIKGLSRNCSIKGDVTYSPPDPHAGITMRSLHEIQNFLDTNPCPPLSTDNFSFSARTVLGEYIQPASDVGEPLVYNENEINKRLEEARILASAGGRPTPPPLDRRMELARLQQAARDARRDASHRSRDQVGARLERSEKAELAKREKEARSQQLLEAKRRKHEEIEKQKIEEQAKRQQERELKRQQAILLKEQERERRRQHTTFIRQLDSRRRWEDRERRKHQNLLDRLLVKEKKLQQRRKEMELLSELRRPQEDSSLSDQKPLPTLNRIPGLKLSGQAMADLLQVYEFILTFGQTIGIDSVLTLNAFQMALLPESSVEEEEELLQSLTQILIVAIEDPGIPHPGRHTTLLGHAIRMGDITPQNVSEVLRIYLYANATGEVKALTGLAAERERERRVADHHQTEAEMQHTCANSKNNVYYETLHNNPTYKLSEALRDKSFLALSATLKARILAFICDELLQNKAVLLQIDARLDHINQLKKERYLMDMKIRKVRVLHQRKVRAEQTEKQQALALERMQRLVEESAASLRTSPQMNDDENQQKPEKPETPKKDKESSPHPESETEKQSEPSPYKESQPAEESDKELSPLKDLSNNMKNKEMLNNNKDECSTADNSKIDKDSVIGDCDANLSDLESEGTQPEEDEDKNLSSEELARKLEKLLKQSEQQQLQLIAESHTLRATCYGQDRYWRRYWSLGQSGGIFVEGMESAQPEIMTYHQQLESNALSGNTPPDSSRRKKKAPREKKEPAPPEAEKPNPETEAQKKEEALKSEMELKSIKSELNLSDHTQIIKYEPNVKHGACKVEGSSIKMEEKYIQQKNNEEQDMLDIEDSIPTAFLVQKPTHKPMFAAQAEPMDKPQEIVKVENVVKNEADHEDIEETKDTLVNNLEELRKMAEAVSIQLDAAKKEQEIKEEKEKVKQEPIDSSAAHFQLYSKILDGKWFSILRHESSFLKNINEIEKQDLPEFCDNEHTCSEVILCQGHKWDVSNNLHLLNDPSLFTLNSMVTSVQVPSNNVYADSSLTMSGLDQEVIDNSFNKDGTVQEMETEEDTKEQDNDLEKELQADALKADLLTQKAKANSLTSLGLLNFNALSTYVTCDSPPPIQMSVEEMDQLESCKVNGLPKKVEGNFVPRELRHGWWRITDSDQLRELMDCLHPRGVRERELHSSLTTHLATVNNKLYIDKGDILGTELCVSHLDRVIAQNGGFPSPDTSHCAVTQCRLDMQLLTMVEQLEERVVAASLQVKGWRPAHDASDGSQEEPVERARQQLQALEAHIERRYLKPPLVQRYASTSEVTLGAVLQAEHGNASAPSPQNTDSASEGKADNKGIARGLATWREAVARCNTSAQLAMCLQALEAAVAWDKSIMKANCQFCLCGNNEDQLLLCDGCDKGYHTYCFKPEMDKIPDGDWYCWVCINKAKGERVCIVCGGANATTRTIPCALCSRAYHQDCHYPPLLKNPRGKWYCSQCISRAPTKKPRNMKKRDARNRDLTASLDIDQNMVPSPAASHASTSTTAEECSGSALHTPEKHDDKLDDTLADSENGLNHHTGELSAEEGPPEKRRALHYVGGNGALQHDETDTQIDAEDRDTENAPLMSRAKKEKNTAKKLQKDLQFCKNLLSEMECHEHAWPFLLPVNTKQFPQYKKVIKCPMDLSTIKRKLQDNIYKCKEEYASDVRLMFSNCEVFNEDDSPVGRAGHNMREFFDDRWTQI